MRLERDVSLPPDTLINRDPLFSLTQVIFGAHLFIVVDERWSALTPALSPEERAGVRASVFQPRSGVIKSG